MTARLLWMPVLRWSQVAGDAAWASLLAERFRFAHGNRGHIVYDLHEAPPPDLARAEPSLASTTPTPGVRGWASWESYPGFAESFDLEIPVPSRASQWRALEVARAQGKLARVMLQRPLGESLNALGHAISLVPQSWPGGTVWIGGESWGWEAAYWVLSLHPEWHLYGAVDFPFATGLAAALARELSVVDCSGAGPCPIAAPSRFGRTTPERAKFRHDPAPTTWL